MSGHTPGPWGLVREYSTIYVGGNARDPRMTQEVAAIGPKEGGYEQQSADAHLICAAPEMLALLEELIDLEGPQPGHIEWARKVQAVIARATGEQP